MTALLFEESTMINFLTFTICQGKVCFAPIHIHRYQPISPRRFLKRFRGFDVSVLTIFTMQPLCYFGYAAVRRWRSRRAGRPTRRRWFSVLSSWASATTATLQAGLGSGRSSTINTPYSWKLHVLILFIQKRFTLTAHIPNHKMCHCVCG